MRSHTVYSFWSIFHEDQTNRPLGPNSTIHCSSPVDLNTVFLLTCQFQWQGSLATTVWDGWVAFSLLCQSVKTFLADEKAAASSAVLHRPQRCFATPLWKSKINFFNIISIILINTKFPRNISAISKLNVSYVLNTWKAPQCRLFLEDSLLEWKRPGGGGTAAQRAC